MSDYQIQKKIKPSIDNQIELYLVGKDKENLISFVSFLRQNKMSPQWGSTNSYNLSYKGRRVCIIKIEERSYQVWVNTQYNEAFNSCFANESLEIKTFLRDRITYCYGCGSCKPGLDMEILGVACKGACFNPVIRMENPDEERLELARKLVMLRRQAIAEGNAPKITYIAMNKRK
ncbi:hypothetical protein [Anaerosporobacter faecicola]|uniref:hypothetical protein n=1 Tax=Anaerosporobacter faecicola TaxID=2718714 RepID=UPI00143C7960|nr:hypothetical protein [Anaerosporobacter faecicola]